MNRIVNGVNLVRLMELEGRVIEPVPAEVRDEFTYWRAAHLGSVALNLIQNLQHLNNSWKANFTHFWDDYSSALNTAKELSKPGSIRQSQFGRAHAAVFAQLAGINESFAYPAMIIGLNPDYNSEIKIADQETPASVDDFDNIFNVRRLGQPLSPGGGYMLPGSLTFNKIDPYSRDTIDDMFNLQDHQ